MQCRGQDFRITKTNIEGPQLLRNIEMDGNKNIQNVQLQLTIIYIHDYDDFISWYVLQLDNFDSIIRRCISQHPIIYMAFSFDFPPAPPYHYVFQHCLAWLLHSSLYYLFSYIYNVELYSVLYILLYVFFSQMQF